MMSLHLNGSIRGKSRAWDTLKILAMKTPWQGEETEVREACRAVKQDH